MGHFAESEQLFASPFKTLIPGRFFWPIFLARPFNHAPTLILVHFFQPSFNLPPTDQPRLPSQEVSEVSEEKLVAAKRGATMP